MLREEVRKVVLRANSTAHRTRGHSVAVPFGNKLHSSALKFVAKDLWLFANQQHSELREEIVKIDTDVSTSKLTRLNTSNINTPSRVIVIQIAHSFYSSLPINWHFLFSICNRDANNIDCLIDLFYDAIGLENKSLEGKYRSDSVVGMIRYIRMTGNFSEMPILADALQDAGFPREELLNHYRDPKAKFSFGSWIFRASGFNCKVKAPQPA